MKTIHSIHTEMAAQKKPRPGSLPLPKDDDVTDPEQRVEGVWRTFDGKPPRPPWKSTGHTPPVSNPSLPPFLGDDPKEIADWEREQRRKEIEANFTGLQKARAKAEELAGAVREDAFDDWIRRCVVTAQKPSEWTQARALYENYVAHAQRFGRNRKQVAMSIQSLASEPQWGRMMATLFPKKRRRGGNYYPLRRKRSK